VKTPQQVLTELTAKYARHWRTWASEPRTGTWPLTLTLSPPRGAGLDGALPEADERIRAWTSFEQDHRQATVEWITRRTKVGQQEVPARLRISSPELVAAIIGREQHYQTAVARWAALSAAWPGHARLHTALAEAIRLDDDDFIRALNVAAWLAAHPRSGLMPRQLPVEGIDTKWITRHSRLLTLLVGTGPDSTYVSSPPAVTTTAAGSRAEGISDTESQTAEQVATLNALGLRPRPTYVRVALLDPGDREQFAGIRDLAVSAEQLAWLTVRPSHLIVIENLETALSLPDMEGVVVVHSLGHNLAPLRDLTWAQQSRYVTYWGDLDAEGFAILSAFRSLGYPARSVLMDEATLVRYRHFAVEGAPAPDRGDLSHLTRTEYDTWQGILSDRWGSRLRLEQERIPLAAGVQALSTRPAETPWIADVGSGHEDT
jgi:hypothetical protein